MLIKKHLEIIYKHKEENFTDTVVGFFSMNFQHNWSDDVYSILYLVFFNVKLWHEYSYSC